MNKNHNNYFHHVPAELFKGRPDEPGKRMGEVIKPCILDEVKQFDCVVLGIPEYAGIIRNGGKISNPNTLQDDLILEKLQESGAPYTVRKRLYSMTTGAFEQHISGKLKIGDLGDIIFGAGRVEEAIERLQDVLTIIYQNDVIPLIIGGGHHISIATIGALAQTKSSTSIGVLVLDAHSDFRELSGDSIHSGVPFRFLLDQYPNVLPPAFVEFGLRPERNAAKYIEELNERGAKTIALDETGNTNIHSLLSFNQVAQNIFLSIDIDVFDIRGASASYPGGLPAKLGRDIAFSYGANEMVKGMDLVEINPLIDHDSSELGAQLLWAFLCGLSRRPGISE